MNNLMIVESPNKRKTLLNILGSDWTIVATFGHLQDLPNDGGLGFDRETLKIDYVLSDTGSKIVNRLKRHINSYDRIVVASDADREGEAIAQHVVDLRASLPCNALQWLCFQRMTMAY